MWLEMAMLRNFSHPNIIRYLFVLIWDQRCCCLHRHRVRLSVLLLCVCSYRGIQYDEDTNEVHVLLEYVPHDMLHLLTRRGRFTEHTVAFLIKQVCQTWMLCVVSSLRFTPPVLSVHRSGCGCLTD